MWRVYFLIHSMRLIWPLLILIAFGIEKFYPNLKGSYWVFFGILFLLILMFSISFEPYTKKGEIVISETFIKCKKDFFLYSELQKIEYSLSKPHSGSIIKRFFGFFKTGYGSYLKLYQNGSHKILFFFLKDSKEREELLGHMKSVVNEFKIEVKEIPFKSPKFPRWADFKNKDLGLNY